MSDGLLFIIAAVLVVAIPLDWWVAVRMMRSAIQRPHIASLTGATLRSVAIAIAATLYGILGIQSVWFIQTGQRLLPTPVPALLIAAGALIVSLPNIYFVRMLSRFAREADDYIVARDEALVRIEAKVDQVGIDAKAAYHEANTVNQKIDARTHAIERGADVDKT